MRYDLRVMWIEDSDDWLKEQREVLEILIEELHVSVDFHPVFDVQEVMTSLEANSVGFRGYDIFLIDYDLSKSTKGHDVIGKIREIGVNSDVLFYSSEEETTIRSIVAADAAAYEGIYVANRGSFGERVMTLIQKNAKQLLSLPNIRGFLMDQTSENDYVCKSYIIEHYHTLPESHRQEILEIIAQSIDYELRRLQSLARDFNPEKTDKSIRSILKLPAALFPLEKRYEIFEKMLNAKGNATFQQNSMADYSNDITKQRNTLAHKKLDVCRQQQYLLYYDDLAQFIERQCDDCSSHTNEFKMSMAEWGELRDKVLRYGLLFGQLEMELRQAGLFAGVGN